MVIGSDLAVARRSVEVARAALECVVDPEIPALSIREIGILRDVQLDDDGVMQVVITPTYSGCPALEFVMDEIRRVLADAGFAQSRVVTRQSPAWTTDWIGLEAREKLLASGIAPPSGPADVVKTLFAVELVTCPRCNSKQAERLSEFGSAACKAQYRCRACKEPFSYFKRF